VIFSIVFKKKILPQRRRWAKMHTYDCVAMVLPQVEFLEKKDMKKTLRPARKWGEKIEKKAGQVQTIAGKSGEGKYSSKRDEGYGAEYWKQQCCDSLSTWIYLEGAGIL